MVSSTDEIHKKQFEIDAIVKAVPKETSSWLWGSKTTCLVRFIVSDNPKVLIGADPTSDRARLTLFANIPMGPLGNKKARIQLYDTDARIFFTSCDDNDDGDMDPFHLKLDPSVTYKNEGELPLILVLNRFVLRVSTNVRIAISAPRCHPPSLTLYAQ